MLTVYVDTASNLIFSSQYTIIVTGTNGKQTICSIEGNEDLFKKNNAGKYTEQIITQQPKEQKQIKLPSPEEIEKSAEEAFKQSIATSYGLKEGIKLWSANVTKLEDVDKLNLADYEKLAIKKYYSLYVKAVIMPKYIVMLAGIAVAVWSYVSPIIHTLI